jgi:hypothetical protein
MPVIPASGPVSASGINTAFGLPSNAPIGWDSVYCRALAKKASGAVSVSAMRGRNVRQNLTVTNPSNATSYRGSPPDRYQVLGRYFGESQGSSVTNWVTMWNVTQTQMQNTEGFSYVGGYLYEPASSYASSFGVNLPDTNTTAVAGQLNTIIFNGVYYGPDTTPAAFELINNNTDDYVASSCLVSLSPSQRHLFPAIVNSQQFKVYVIGDS